MAAEVKAGVATIELDRIAEDMIRGAGGIPSFIGVPGRIAPFRHSLCISINEEVVHGIPGPRRIREGDVVSIDAGAIVDGWHGDGARSFIVGAVPEATRTLVEATREAMYAGIAAARVGNHLGDISAAIEDDNLRRRQVQEVPGQVARALGIDQGDVEAAASLLKDAGHGVVIGRGFNYATAFEISLKAKELAYVAVEGYSAADFQHGPIALVETGFAAIVVNVGGGVSGEVDDLLRTLTERGARPVVISNVASSLALASAPLCLPPDIPEWLSPIAAVVPGQLLAFALSRARGFEPDRPRGLKKVTKTT
jgi:fructoselysine-6-P-deglycase FrlB-like protein